MSETRVTVAPRAPSIRPGGARSTRPVSADPLEGIVILDAEPGNSMPSMLLMGDTGTGKTHGIGQVLRYVKSTGRASLVLGIENKWQALAKYGPKVIPVTAPVNDGGMLRRARPSEVYDRMQRVVDAIATGGFREHGGAEIVLLAVDGLMEVCDIIARHLKSEFPTARTTGEKNTYALYDSIGEKSVDFFKSLRDASSEATRAFGAAPLGVIATCGEAFEADKFGGSGLWKPILPGNIGPRALPYQFEAIIRLSLERGLDNELVYVANLASGDDFKAKCPAIGLPARISGAIGSGDAPDVGVIYQRLIAYYQDTATDANDAPTPANPVTQTRTSRTEESQW